MELASLVGFDELSCVLQSGRPVEPAPESLSDEGVRRGVVAAFASVDVGEELEALFG